MKGLATCVLLQALTVPAFAQTQAAPAEAPIGGAYRHLGVASCATSVCHGKLAPQTGRDVALNEYRTWLLQDRHSQAYRALEKPLSKSIAQKLGIGNPTTAAICLDCHADNVPAARRGPKFQLTDGIGCEACHGGAEKWIESHSAQTATHAANLSRGMYPTESPQRRAALCLSCHLGTQSKFATHAIMGAGHPRLRFELDTFTTNQPAHYVVDADYVQRKGKVDETGLWVAGQIEAARASLVAIQSHLASQSGFFPELAVYDCFGCHHSIDKLRWTRERAGSVQPGSVRLQKQHLTILEAVADAMGDPAASAEIADGARGLTRAGQTDPAAIRESVRKLLDTLRTRANWTQRTFSSGQTTALRRTLLQYAAADRASDYLAAEQIVLGVESLSYSLGDHERHNADVDALYNAVKTSASFDPSQFATVARQVTGHF